MLAPILLSLTVVAAPQQQDADIITTQVADGVYMLVGAGGNLGLSIGDDGAFLVDDQFEWMTDKILAAIAELTDQEIRFVVNTHWHGDHTGGNENLGKAGAVIVAHANVRHRMSTEQFVEAFQRRVEPSPDAALPAITFTDTVTFHFNGDDVHVEHVEPAHTDGDSFIHLRKANVLHTGDLFFANGYPFIDVSSGGNLAGMIAAADRMLAVCNDTTKVIPGHGPLSDTAGLRAYRDMLAGVHDEVASMVEAGSSRQEVIDGKPTARFDEQWGKGFFKADVWVGFVYDGFQSNSR